MSGFQRKRAKKSISLEMFYPDRKPNSDLSLLFFKNDFFINAGSNWHLRLLRIFLDPAIKKKKIIPWLFLQIVHVPSPRVSVSRTQPMTFGYWAYVRNYTASLLCTTSSRALYSPTLFLQAKPRGNWRRKDWLTTWHSVATSHFLFIQ